MDPMTAFFVASSTALSMYGNFMSSQAEAENAYYQAQMEEDSIYEMYRRQEENQTLLLDQTRGVLAGQEVATAGQGFTSGGASFADLQMSTLRNAHSEISRQNRELGYAASVKRRNAAIMRKTGKSIETAGTINLIAQGAQAGYSYSKVAPGKEGILGAGEKSGGGGSTIANKPSAYPSMTKD